MPGERETRKASALQLQRNIHGHVQRDAAGATTRLELLSRPRETAAGWPRANGCFSDYIALSATVGFPQSQKVE